MTELDDGDGVGGRDTTSTYKPRGFNEGSSGARTGSLVGLIITGILAAGAAYLSTTIPINKKIDRYIQSNDSAISSLQVADTSLINTDANLFSSLGAVRDSVDTLSENVSTLNGTVQDLDEQILKTYEKIDELKQINSNYTIQASARDSATASKLEQSAAQISNLEAEKQRLSQDVSYLTQVNSGEADSSRNDFYLKAAIKADEIIQVYNEEYCSFSGGGVKKRNEAKRQRLADFTENNKFTPNGWNNFEVILEDLNNLESAFKDYFLDISDKNSLINRAALGIIRKQLDLDEGTKGFSPEEKDAIVAGLE